MVKVHKKYDPVENDEFKNICLLVTKILTDMAFSFFHYWLTIPGLRFAALKSIQTHRSVSRFCQAAV